MSVRPTVTTRWHGDTGTWVLNSNNVDTSDYVPSHIDPVSGSDVGQYMWKCRRGRKHPEPVECPDDPRYHPPCDECVGQKCDGDNDCESCPIVTETLRK